MSPTARLALLTTTSDNLERPLRGRGLKAERTIQLRGCGIALRYDQTNLWVPSCSEQIQTLVQQPSCEALSLPTWACHRTRQPGLPLEKGDEARRCKLPFSLYYPRKRTQGLTVFPSKSSINLCDGVFEGLAFVVNRPAVCVEH